MQTRVHGSGRIAVGATGLGCMSLTSVYGTDEAADEPVRHRLWSSPVGPLRPIVDWITSLELGHPARVGLGGRSAAGQTTLAHALAAMLEQLGRAPVLSDGVVVVDCLSLADAYSHWAGEDDEHARRFGWYPLRSTSDGVRKSIIESQRQWREGRPRRSLAIRKADTRTLVGGCETRLQSDGTGEVS